MTDNAEEKVVVFCTVSSLDEGASIAKAVVGEKLAACVNMLDGLRSIYVWKGEVCDDGETLLVIKTRRDMFEKLRERIVALHSYDVPEVVALPIIAGHQPYLDWIDTNVKS